MSFHENPADFDEIARMKRDGEVYCRDCAAIISAKAEICPRCGVRQTGAMPVVPARTTPPKSRIITALLALFLGGFGIHKFYLGQTLVGILYSIFFWTLVLVFIFFIDCVFFLIISVYMLVEKFT